MYRYRIYSKEQRDTFRLVIQKGDIIKGWHDVLIILTPDIAILEYIFVNYTGIDFNDDIIDKDWVNCKL